MDQNGWKGTWRNHYGSIVTNIDDGVIRGTFTTALEAGGFSESDLEGVPSEPEHVCSRGMRAAARGGRKEERQHVCD